MREYIYGVAERWLRFGIDGWRLDVPEEIGEPGFWEEFRRRCLAVNPEAYLVGEIWNARAGVAGRRTASTPLMNYPLAEAILSFVGAGRLDAELVAKTHEYARHVHPIDGPEFGRQLERRHDHLPRRRSRRSSSTCSTATTRPASSLWRAAIDRRCGWRR